MSKFEQRYIVQDLESHEFIYPDPFGDIGFTANLKAAGFQLTAARRRLVVKTPVLWSAVYSFNSQPPEGGWSLVCVSPGWLAPVSTHSRPKAAGPMIPP